MELQLHRGRGRSPFSDEGVKIDPLVGPYVLGSIGEYLLVVTLGISSPAEGVRCTCHVQGYLAREQTPLLF